MGNSLCFINFKIEKHLVIKPKKAKGDDGYKVFSIRIKEEIVTQIDDISARTGHSRNELIGAFFRIRGEWLIALAIASRCFMPRENWETGCFPVSFSPTIARASSILPLSHPI